jgi:hypothetical protein
MRGMDGLEPALCRSGESLKAPHPLIAEECLGLHISE